MGFTEWERIPEVISKGEVTGIGHEKNFGGEAYAFVVREGGEALVVLDVPQNSKRGGKRVTILTAFRDNAVKVENWLKQRKREAASSQGASGSPAHSGSETEQSLVSENGEPLLFSL